MVMSQLVFKFALVARAPALVYTSHFDTSGLCEAYGMLSMNYFNMLCPQSYMGLETAPRCISTKPG